MIYFAADENADDFQFFATVLIKGNIAMVGFPAHLCQSFAVACSKSEVIRRKGRTIESESRRDHLIQLVESKSPNCVRLKMRLSWGQLNDWAKPAQLASRGFSGTGCLLSVQTWSAVFWPHIESLLQPHCWWEEFLAFPAHRQWAHHISGPADAFCRSDHLRMSWDKVGTWRHRVCFQISPRSVTPSPSCPTVCPSNSLCPCCMSPLPSPWG